MSFILRASQINIKKVFAYHPGSPNSHFLEYPPHRTFSLPFCFTRNPVEVNPSLSPDKTRATSVTRSLELVPFPISHLPTDSVCSCARQTFSSTSKEMAAPSAAPSTLSKCVPALHGKVISKRASWNLCSRKSSRAESSRTFRILLTILQVTQTPNGLAGKLKSKCVAS